MYREIFSLVLAGLIGASASVHSSDNYQHDKVTQLSPGLVRIVRYDNGRRTIRYHAANRMAGYQLRMLLQQKGNDVEKLFPSSVRLAQPAAFSTSNYCSATLSGAGSLAQMTGYINVDCSDSSNLAGVITWTPILGTYQPGSQNYTGTPGHLLASYSHHCAIVGTTVCGHSNYSYQDDWEMQESWESDNGESGYACQVGIGYDYYVEAYGCTDEDI